MKRLAVLAALCASAAFTQTADLGIFRARMLPSNEIPPHDVNGSAMATIFAHVLRDSSGQIISGTVDFDVNATFPADIAVTGMHIHSGDANTNGPVTIDSGLSGGNPLQVKAGPNAVFRQARVTADNPAALATLRGMFQNPSQYYANIHTTEFPAGVMRGQLERADMAVFMGFMRSANEVPPPTNTTADGIAQVIVIYTHDSSGKITSARVSLDSTFRFPEAVQFSGFHIHPAAAGVNGPVGIGASLPAGAASDQTGTGNLGPFVTEVNLDNSLQLSTLQALLATPENTYLNVHTTVNPGGVMRTQLHATDHMTFQPVMLASNENPPTGINASAPAKVDVFTLRNEDGTVAAGSVAFDVNPVFPGRTQFTGLHIHTGAAGVNGPVVLPSFPAGTPAVFETGTGNFGLMIGPPIASGAGLDALNGLVRNPENYYINLHTTDFPGGAVRAQLTAVNSGPPVITHVLSGTLDTNGKVLAPGSLVSIFGTNLAKVTADLSGWSGRFLPEMLNGVAVAVDGQRARILYVSPTQINAQLSFDTPLGSQLLAVNNGNTPGQPIPVTIAAAAPELFFVPGGAAIAAKATDFSLITPSNPARAGDIIAVFATGLGQTNPALKTGELVALDSLPATMPVSVTMGSQNAQVASSFGAPGYAGVYVVAFTVPSGLTAGNVPVIVKAGAATSNTVMVAVR